MMHAFTGISSVAAHGESGWWMGRPYLEHGSVARRGSVGSMGGMHSGGGVKQVILGVFRDNRKEMRQRSCFFASSGAGDNHMWSGRHEKTDPQRSKTRMMRLRVSVGKRGFSAVSGLVWGHGELHGRVCVHVSFYFHGGPGGMFTF